ncbi:M20 family metallopeptidase [Enterococcus saccharolyticus]|uniref:M20 family metallopeptidase n=1 Tax=Enterococcus saccharolyticus TaxID=41997 RepID=UPI001E367310|nr:M20 family metallopeptidase [Enterococcus saccharolyticus]MCD5001267.1 M20 family metallopeptidase [Enterococcus saccharolyticus]
MLQEIKKEIEKNVEERKPELIELSEYIHSHPELGYEEFLAVEKITTYLINSNIEVENNYCGLETSFKATHTQGDGEIHFAILAEYDALPKLGHACGHNIIASSAVGAFLATKTAMEIFDISGKVSLIGTPAEEGGGGKIKLIERGAFEDIDAATMVHPTSGTTRIAGRCTATYKFTIEYLGHSAHAASQPFKGVNALDAANLFFNAVAMLRQQVTSDTRLSGILVEGGTATGMIPDYSKIEYSIRCMEEDELPHLVEKVKNCIQAGALATGCKVNIEEEKGYGARTFSRVLGNICREALEELGEPVLPDFPDDFGSTDFGNVSQLIPTTNPYFSLNKTRVSLHTAEYEKLANLPISHTAIERSAKAMSMTVVETFLNPTIMELAKEEKNELVDVNIKPR